MITSILSKHLTLFGIGKVLQNLELLNGTTSNLKLIYFLTLVLFILAVNINHRKNLLYLPNYAGSL